jgi:hypothetical protein
MFLDGSKSAANSAVPNKVIIVITGEVNTNMLFVASSVDGQV